MCSGAFHYDGLSLMRGRDDERGAEGSTKNGKARARNSTILSMIHPSKIYFRKDLRQKRGEEKRGEEGDGKGYD